MGKLLVLFVTAFVDTAGIAMVVPILPYYATRFGASDTTVGFLISVFSIAQLVCAPAWGRLSDRYGRRPAILAGLAITAVAYVIFALADSVALLMLSRIVQGIGGGTIGVVQAYVADASPPEQRTKSLGWLTAVTSFGAVAGPGLGSLLIVAGGHRAPGLAAGAFSALVAVFAWRFLRESKRMPVSGALGARAEPRSQREALVQVVTRFDEPAPRLIWIYAVAIGAFYGTAPMMPLLMFERLGITERTVGYVVMYFGGMGVLVRAGLLGPLVDWLGEARVARAGIVLLAAGLGALSFARTWPSLMLACTLMPLGTAFLFPCLGGRLTRVVASSERGLYLGVQQTFGGVSRVAFPLAAGAAMDQTGRATPFVVAGLLVLLTLPLARAMDTAPLDQPA